MKQYLVLLICISYYSFSQEELTLEKAIEYGVANSHDIAIVKNDASIVQNSNHLGAAGMLPNISISSGYNGSANTLNDFKLNPFYQFNDGGDSDAEFSFDDMKGTRVMSSTLTASISLNYRLFNGFSGIYTLHKFKTQNTIANETIRYQIESKIIEIVNQYYDLLNKQNIYETFKTTYNISLDRYSQSVEKYDFGSISKRELLNIEVILNEDKIKMNEAFIHHKSSKLNLALAIGVQESSFSINKEFSFNTALNIDELLKQANLNNANVLIAELNYSVAQDELKISKGSYLPKVDFFTSYDYTNTKNEISQFSEINNNGFVGGLNVEIPIFSSNMRKNSMQNAKINLDSKSHYLENIKNTIKTALLNTYYSYVDGLSSLDLMKQNLNTAEKNYEMSKELYEMGQLSNIEYRESQLQLDQIRINYSVKLSTTKTQEYVIYQLSGQLKTQ